MLRRGRTLTLELQLPVQRDLGVKAALGVALAGGGRGGGAGTGRGGDGVEGRGGKHLRRAVGQVHRVHGGAVEFVEVQAGDVVVGVDDLFVFLLGERVSTRNTWLVV